MATTNKNWNVSEKLAQQYGPAKAPTQSGPIKIEAPKTGMSSTTTFNPNRSYTEQAMNQMSGMMNTPFQASAVPKQTLGQIENMINTPFSYNSQTDEATQAAIQRAKRESQRNQVNTNAMLRASGQGRSSYSEGVANQIAANTLANIENDIIPFYQQQAYQRHQDQISNLGNLYSYQNQEYFLNPMQEAQFALQEGQTTGNYLPIPARQAIQNILSLKQQAETPGITPQQLQGLSQQAQQYRDQLDSMGIDSSQFGADVNRQQSLANFARAGIPTLESARMQEDTRRYDQDFAEDVRRYDQDFSEMVRQYGVDTALRQAGMEQDAQQFAQQMGYNWAQLSQRDKEFVADQVWREKQYDLDVRRENRLDQETSSVGGTIDAKTSFDNYDIIIGDMDAALTEGILTKEMARQLVEVNRDNLTDADYKRAKEWINDNL